MISTRCSSSYLRWTLTNMFIAVVMQLRGLACGVILTTQMSSMVLALDGFASALLLLSKPGAPINFSSTNRYLSILFASENVTDRVARSCELLNRTLPPASAKAKGGCGFVERQMVFHADIWLKRIL